MRLRMPHNVWLDAVTRIKALNASPSHPAQPRKPMEAELGQLLDQIAG